MNDTSAGSSGSTALRMLQFEQAEFERFLHDELGQSLVALRSMAAALGDGADSDIVELVSLTANDAYVEVYDRMMELRAEALAQEPNFADAVRQCLDDARLEARDLAYRLQMPEDIDQSIGPVQRRLVLRGLRGLVNALKRGDSGGGELRVALTAGNNGIDLQLQLQPGGFPAAFLEQPQLRRLDGRLRAFGGDLLANANQDIIDVHLRLSALDASGP